jgi:hypothetical protein
MVLLTAAPAAQAGWLGLLEDAAKVAAKDAAKAGAKGAEATANGVKIENKLGVGGLAATGVAVEANAVKVENKVGGGLPGGSGGGGGYGAPPVWFFVLCVVRP